MSNRRISGYWIVVVTLTAGAALAAWYDGAALYPSAPVRVLVVLLVGALMLLARGFFMDTWHGIARHTARRNDDKYERDSRARIGAAKGSTSATDAQQRKDTLTHTLQERYGRRWRYRTPWLLLTGSDAAVSAQLPTLVEHGYLIRDDAVLLWQASGTNGHPDTAWLRQLYALRRRRPVDGIVFVVDGNTRVLPPARVALSRIQETLRWSAPVYVLDIAAMENATASAMPLAGWACEGRTGAAAIQADLLALRDQLAYLGVQHLSIAPHDPYAALLSQRLDGHAAPLAAWLDGLIARRVPVRGVFFAPSARTASGATHAAPLAERLWSHLGTLARRERGRATASHPISLGAIAGVVLAGLWLGGMLISASLNAGDLRRSHALVQALERDGNDAARLRDLLALQERIERYETRRRDYLSILAGFGLNRDRDTLQALWTRYTSLSRTLLVQPVQLSLEASLRSLSRMRADMPPGRDTQRHNYELLKAYLMLGEPRRVEPAFLAQQLASAWPMVTGLSPGAWQDTAQRLATFFAQHLPAHPAWRVDASASLIAATRRLLVNQVDLANADDAVYHALLDRARGMYADVSLPMLLHGADAQGLFTTTQTVPGVYTRAAWEGMVADAIDKAASEQRVQDDWVLRGETDTSTAQAGSHDAVALKQRLTARYFADYAAAWQHMLNSIQWQTPTTLNAAIDQLTRLTDAQTSPLIALMRAVQEQAQAGRPRQALADTLVSRAQSLMGRDINGQALAPTLSASPLDTAFGPLLALMGDARAGLRQDERDGTAGASPALGGISLQSYLTDATALRLTLQQIASSPDASAMARETVQAVFQGKLSTLAQIREQAALTAASVGSSWAGAGQTLFARPIDAAWQTILQPAAASLNDLWRTSIAVPFNTAFDGRYPFFDTDADASFAELSRYVRPDTGLIAQFLATQLGGVLNRQGDQWMPNGLAPSTLPLDPAFLQAMQQLTALGTQLCAQGDAGYRFEIMALPTPNVARTTLTIDQQQIAYFNQMQTWTPLRWPGDGLSGRASLVWQTLDATPRSAFNASGDWAFLRLLARAQVKPLDSTRYALTWQEPDAEPLRYVLRTQVGEGPLALLQLRGFTMPERVFKVETNATAAAAPPLTPLPPQRALP